jgi:hypothetical protein
MSFNSQYIITNIAESNNQRDRAFGIEQIPIIFSVNGAINIRRDIEQIVVTACTNELNFSEACNSQYIPII